MKILRKLMLLNRRRLVRASISLFALALCVSAASIDFEQFADREPVANEILGIQFTHTTVITAGFSLNEIELPPHSGINVAFDDGGPITITFVSPITSFQGYFTYGAPLVLKALGPANTLVASVNSQFASNEAISGDPESSPNEFLKVDVPSGFMEVTLTADPAGGSFVMDDLSFTLAPNTATPEPAFRWIIGTGIALLFCNAGRLRRRSESF